MKKLFSICLVIMVLSVAIVPVAFAQVGTDLDKLPIIDKFPTTGPMTGVAVLNQIGVIGNWIFALLMGIALIFVVLGALQFVTGGGDPAKVSEARQKMIWAAVGIGFALLAAFFDNILQALLGIT
jgi:hypothetical protein